MNHGPATLSATAADPKRSVVRGYDMQYHGTAEIRGGNCPRSRYYDQGRFGRLFPTLHPFVPDFGALAQLGAKGGPMDGGNPPNTNPDHPNQLPAGFTFLGQFVDHDITFDPTSSLERQVDPEAVENFRTPLLELDSVYGSGPGASPHLYTRANRDLLLVGKDTGGGDNDLPRNSEGTALIGDPRNDENLIVSQLQLAFIKFHNTVARDVANAPPPSRSVFEEAQRIVRWHYQWILIHEFIPAIVGQAVMDSILGEPGPRFYKPRNEAFIPVEFSVAAYRFGHSQIRPGYAISANFARALFVSPPPNVPPGQPPPDLSGGRVVVPDQKIEWNRFFDLGGGSPQVGKRFDPELSPPLMDLPGFSNQPGDPSSLAARNLMRGVIFGLPSGQDVANAMGEQPLSPDELGAPAKDLGFADQAPLWFYILKEAEVRTGGDTLGPVGGRIVGEVLLGILTADRCSYLRAAPNWKPFLGTNQEFRMADLLKIAELA